MLARMMEVELGEIVLSVAFGDAAARRHNHLGGMTEIDHRHGKALPIDLKLGDIGVNRLSQIDRRLLGADGAGLELGLQLPPVTGAAFALIVPRFLSRRGRSRLRGRAARKTDRTHGGGGQTGQH